ncbi:arf-GAP with dual PH domain-containing protein 1-like isoform X3 [Channa argus]|uniref:arf-GAP with dual PH domain-containing protein 1-like isoform X3 n=1 Tax=Channa argus TaxID=215402 RepID=UPI00352056AA
MASLDRNNKLLLDMVRQPGNNLCADCGAPEPDWASYTLGIFVCLTCSGLHRNLPAVSKVKSIRLDFWEDSLVEFMQERGNSAAKAIFEKCVPGFFYRPQQKDCVVLKDQWIRAKYERREFTGENYLQQVYSTDVFESTLWKKGKDNKQFLKRIFLLNRKDFTLRYFIKEDSKVPKAVISMKDLNAVFQPEKIGHAHGLQISYLQDERTRNLFVYHENGQVIVSMFNAIRSTRLAYLQKKHLTLQDNDLILQITGNCLKEGYMEKTGPTVSAGAIQEEVVHTVLNEQKASLLQNSTESSNKSTRGGRWHRGITLQTPSRQFVFMCEQDQEQKEWLEAFRKVISQPMTPEDYANEANLRRGK